MYPIILAGGVGTRLWPVSRKNAPKQMKIFYGKESLLRHTWRRIAGKFKIQDIFLATSSEFFNLVKLDLPEIKRQNISLEPCRRDTAPALGLALAKVHKRDNNAVFTLVNSDGHIKNEKEYFRMLDLAEKTVKKHPEKIVLIGVKPKYPETGYGYIRMGNEFLKFPHPLLPPPPKGRGREGGGGFSSNINKFDEIYTVESFVEKPDLKTAQKMVDSWEYLWNATMIVSRVDTFLSLYKKYLPKIYKGLMEIEKSIGAVREKEVIKNEFLKMDKISLDYGILEKVSKNEPGKMLALPADLGWADVGHWRAVFDVLSDKKNNNVVYGQYFGLDSNKNLIYNLSQKLVVTLGLEEMIVVEMPDVVFVAPKSKAQEVKRLVGEMEKDRKLKKFI